MCNLLLSNGFSFYYRGGVATSMNLASFWLLSRDDEVGRVVVVSMFFSLSKLIEFWGETRMSQEMMFALKILHFFLNLSNLKMTQFIITIQPFDSTYNYPNE
jgi:hypothetical protein